MHSRPGPGCQRPWVCVAGTEAARVLPSGLALATGGKKAAMDGHERYAAMTWVARHGCAFLRVFSCVFLLSPERGAPQLPLALAAARPGRERGRDMSAPRPPEATHPAAEGEGA